MDNPGYIILSRLALQNRATAILAHNLANADTPGFRALRPIFGDYLLQQERTALPRGGRTVAFVQDRATWRETTPGPILTTGNPLDLALAGDGFFAVETRRGERYTRAGRFTIGDNGRIVDMEGNPLLSSEGTPIALAPNDTRLTVQGDGTIRSENGVLGRLRIVRFDDVQALRAEGDRLFAAAGEEPKVVENPAVLQGAVEGSNVRPILELTRLTAELREFQFAVQFAERESERLSSAIERILRRR